MMNNKELEHLWRKHGLSTRYSYSPEFIKEICDEFNVVFNNEWVYTKPKYRELADENTPRVDALTFLKAVAIKNHVYPNEQTLKIANQMFGEGSRRDMIEKAYFGGD